MGPSHFGMSAHPSPQATEITRLRRWSTRTTSPRGLSLLLRPHGETNTWSWSTLLKGALNLRVEKGSNIVKRYWHGMPTQVPLQQWIEKNMKKKTVNICCSWVAGERISLLLIQARSLFTNSRPNWSMQNTNSEKTDTSQTPSMKPRCFKIFNVESSWHEKTCQQPTLKSTHLTVAPWSDQTFLVGLQLQEARSLEQSPVGSSVGRCWLSYQHWVTWMCQ